MNDLNNIVITDVLNAVTVFSPKGRADTMQNRKSYGLSFCLEGQITYTQNGKKYVSDKNHAVILPKGQTYSIHGDKSGMFPVINFECTNFCCDTITVLPVENVDFAKRDFLQMKNLFLFEKNRSKIMSLFYNIIHSFIGLSPTGENILNPAIKYLENHYSSPYLTNAMLAKECNISEVYFRKLFVNQFGITPHQYIIDIRINNARQLLAEGALKINAVAEKCGFSNPYHFTRLFKEKTGLSPTEYMNRNRILKI